MEKIEPISSRRSSARIPVTKLDGIQLSIKDDGQGYDEENISGRKTSGIPGMKE